MRRLVLAAALLVAGCGPDFWAFSSIQNTNNPRSTLVLVWLADSPVDGADALEVTIEKVELVRADGVEVLSSTARTLDLLTLRGGTRTKLVEAEVPAVAYQSVRLTLREGGALGPRMRTAGTWSALPFAAPGTNVVDVPYAFSQDADRSEVHIDFNARLSVVDAPGGPQLDPHLDAVDSMMAGEIAGFVRDAGGVPVAGALVVVLRSGLETRSATTLLDGSYRMPWLAPGTYEVEVFSPAGPLVTVPGVLLAPGGAENVILTLP